MPARSRRRIDRDDLAWVTARLAWRRDQLNIAAVARDRTARAALRLLDAKLPSRVTRGVKDLRGLASLVAAEEDEDLNATAARETRLAGTAWYRLNAFAAEAIETFFAGWSAA